MADDKLIDRIRKLLALSKSDNQHEAELAAQKASDLMLLHQIAVSQVEISEEESVSRSTYVVEDLAMKYMWVYRLGRAAAVLFDGDAVNNGSLHGTSFMFVGRPSDIEAMRAMFEHFYKTWQSVIPRDLQKAKEASGVPFQPRDTMKYKLGHGQGFADALFWRCWHLQQDRHAAVRKSGSRGTDLVVSREAELKSYMKDQGFVNSTSSESQGAHAGRKDGKALGESIPLGGAVSHSNIKMLGR